MMKLDSPFPIRNGGAHRTKRKLHQRKDRDPLTWQKVPLSSKRPIRRDKHGSTLSSPISKLADGYSPSAFLF